MENNHPFSIEFELQIWVVKRWGARGYVTTILRRRHFNIE